MPTSSAAVLHPTSAAFALALAALVAASPAQDNREAAAQPAASTAASTPAQPLTYREFQRAYGRWASQGAWYAYIRVKPEVTEADRDRVWQVICAAEDATTGGFTREGLDLSVMDLPATRHALLDVLRFNEVPKERKSLEEQAGKYAEAIEALEKAQISQSLQIIWRVALGQRRQALGGDHAALAGKDFAQAVDLIGKLVRLEGMDEQTQRMMYHRLAGGLLGLPVAQGDALLAVLEGDDIKSRWLAEMLAGEWHTHVAWHLRTARLANDVTPEGWAGFNRHLPLAYDRFTKAHDLRPNLPEAASRLIAVAMGGHTPEDEPEQVWFDRAVKACFDWEPAYHSYAYALEPRWGGSDEAIIAFGRRCKATGRYDTDIPYQLLYACQRVDRNRDGDGTVWREQYAPVREMLLTYASRREHFSAHAHSRLLALAWLAGRWGDGVLALEALGEKPPSEVVMATIVGEGVPTRRITSEVRALAGRHAARIEEAQDLAAQGRWTDAAAVMEAVAAAARDDAPLDRVAVLDLVYPLLHQADFKAGAPVNLRLEEGLPGWDASDADRARFKVTGPASLSADSASVVTTARFGRRYCVETDILCSPQEANAQSAAVILLSEHTPGGPGDQECSLVISTANGRSSARATGIARLDARLEPSEKPRRVRIQVWDERWVVEVDGVELGNGRAFADATRHPDGDAIGFGATGEVSFENIRIQRLTQRPKSLADAEDAPGNDAPKPPPADAAPELEEPEPFSPRL